MTQIDRDVDLDGCGLGTGLGQRRRFEFQNLGLVQFVDFGPAGPRQPPRTGIQSGGQNHHLAHAGSGRGKEELVEKYCAAGHVVDHCPHPRGKIRLGFNELVRQARPPHSPDAFARGIKEHPCKRVRDQRGLLLAGCGAGRRDAQRCGSHTLGNVPGIVIGSRHRHSSHSSPTRFLTVLAPPESFGPAAASSGPARAGDDGRDGEKAVTSRADYGRCSVSARGPAREQTRRGVGPRSGQPLEGETPPYRTSVENESSRLGTSLMTDLTGPLPIPASRSSM